MRSKMHDEAVDVSIVVPCRNEIHHIRAFLDSVLRQDLGDLRMEVLIADGMSDDGTRQVLAEYEHRFPFVRVMDNPEKIVSTAANRAIREARGETIVRMDAHTIYASRYVRSCLEVLKETGAGNVGGPALTRATGYLAEAIAHAFHSRFASGGAKYRDPEYEGPVASVPYGCFRKSTLDGIGLYDEDLVCGQDVELNFRIISSGGIVWQSPRIASWYAPRTTLAKLFRQHFQYGFWKIGILRKHRRIVSWRSIVPGSCLLAGALLLVCAGAASLDGFAGWRRLFLAGFSSLAGAYIVASCIAALRVSRRYGWCFLPVLPVVFGTYHLSYALGSFLAVLCRPTIEGLPGPIRKVLMAPTR
jgi:succinoglycan biosynthesis protein ExoA